MILWPLAALLALMAVVGFMVASKLSKWANPKMPPMPQPTRTGKKQAYSADQPEVVIIGAGVVGGTMAIQFAKQGRHVTVIERQMEAPDRIVGEFLQPGGYKKMVELGIDGTSSYYQCLVGLKMSCCYLWVNLHNEASTSLGTHTVSSPIPFLGLKCF